MVDAIQLELIKSQKRTFVLDTNVLIHDPNAVMNFDEHKVIIPITVLEELDKLKTGKHTIAADCRQAIRVIDQILGCAPPAEVEQGVPIRRYDESPPLGTLAIMMPPNDPAVSFLSPANDNIIINHICSLQHTSQDEKVILVSKDINMRLKARGCGIESQDYHNDQLITDVEFLSKGYQEVTGSFWEQIQQVSTIQEQGRTLHVIPKDNLTIEVYPNKFILDEQGFIGQIKSITSTEVTILDLSHDFLMQQEAWGLQPRDIYQAMALQLLLDPDIHLVNLTGAAGSGKTILALAAAIEMTVASKRYRRIIATRSVQGLDEDIGFLPGTEEEKMEPWLGAITDNLEALHCDDECTHSSIDYILKKVPLHFKSLNYIRGRSFQHSLIIIDECQNLTPHQMKTIITRAGNGSKVICLGNLAQIDTPYLSATSSGLTYLTERFKNFAYGGNIQLRGVPRSLLAEFAEQNL
ncbi:PhoH family protein [Spartinivicinus ruber]|uniref:PhoH family protein n=1 Tax=Spartinivicinus ruber TaxID=2683272 RepID=UPI0013D3E7CA|nr:PhoH family protein [Spartinivicinus ruber]